MKGTRLAPVVLAATLLVGCGSTQVEGGPGGSQEDEGAQGQTGAAVDVSVLREAYGSLDYPTFPSPEAMAGESDVVATGVVRALEDGHAWLSDRGHDVSNVRHRYAVIQVDLTEVVKGRKHAVDGQVYVQLYRGSEAIDESGEPLQPSGAPSTVTSMESLRNAILSGTRVAVLGTPVDFGERSPEELSGVEKGRPEGATLISPQIEGLIFDGGEAEGAVGGIVDIPERWFQTTAASDTITFDDLARRLTR